MVYVVQHKEAKGTEISLDQFLTSDSNLSQVHKTRKYPGTITLCYDALPHGLYTPDYIQYLIQKLERFCEAYGFLSHQLQSHYRQFEIPKQDGTNRTIYAPNTQLSKAQIALRTIFEEDFRAGYHTSAFAYCKGRSPLLCIQRHQAAQSRWFLKLDFADFFGNTTFHFVVSQLIKIAPFSEVIKDERGNRFLRQALRLCFLNDGLPQGTPISPMLTNLVMIPVDHEIANSLHSKGLTYTRYADDILISGRTQFSPENIIRQIRSILSKHHTPYQLKTPKTRFGSSNGRNWNLGLMLNHNNQITIGHKQHKLLKAMLNNFILDYKNQKAWNMMQALQLMGYLAYYASIEPQNMKYMIHHFEEKYHVSVHNMLAKCIHEEALQKKSNNQRLHTANYKF